MLRLRRPLPVIAAAFGLRLSAADPVAVDDGLSLQERRRLEVVDLCFRLWPVQGTCLRRSLVVGWIVRRHAPVLRIGVRRGRSGVLLAHAWVDVPGHSSDPSAHEYQVLDL